MQADDTIALSRMAADIVVAFLGQAAVPRSELPALVREIRAALEAPRSDLAPPVALVPPAGSPPLPGPAAGAESVALEAQSDGGASVDQAPRRPVPIDQTIHDQYIICLEDGRPYRSLRRHLMVKYGMSPADYRAKWGLPADYPMVAPSYARDRSEVAKRIGLGQKASKRPSAKRAGV